MSKETLFNPKDDFKTANMLGLFKGVASVESFAIEVGMAAGIPVVLGTGTATPLLPPDAGTFVQLLSADAGNAGAEIQLDVLDANFKARTVTVSIAGAGEFPIIDPDTDENLLITRINFAKNLGPRNGGEVVGNILIHELGTPANVYGTVDAISQEMQQAVFTVPAGTVWGFSGLVASMRKSGGTDTDVELTLIGGAVGQALRRLISFGIQRSGGSSLVFEDPEITGASSPVDLMLEATSSSAGSDVSAYITLRTAETTA